MDTPRHFVRLPDGSLEDTRYRYARGTKVRVIEGPHKGHVATVNSCVGQFHAGGEMVLEPGYQVTLDDDRELRSDGTGLAQTSKMVPRCQQR